MIDHVSFYATDYDTTRNFVPGLHEAYHAKYYGAFVLDPDGNNVEAVCHLAQG